MNTSEETGLRAAGSFLPTPSLSLIYHLRQRVPSGKLT